MKGTAYDYGGIGEGFALPRVSKVQIMKLLVAVAASIFFIPASRESVHHSRTGWEAFRLGRLTGGRGLDVFIARRCDLLVLRMGGMSGVPFFFFQTWSDV